MTDDNVWQPEQRQTHLVMLLNEAELLVMAQVKKGEELSNSIESVQSEEEFRSLEKAYKGWREYTARLLKRDTIFDTNELHDKFGTGFYDYGFVGRIRTPANLMNSLDEDVRWLRSLYQQLELFPVRVPQPRPSEDEAGKKPIFISYRRVDSAGHAGRLYDRLSKRFGEGQIFMDVATIESGLNFPRVVEEAAGSCDVLIAIIGKQWLTITDATGRRRLDDPGDLVCLEIATALVRNIQVIPVLVGGATMPPETDLPDALKKLSHRNALEISDTRFDYDVRRLIERLQKLLGMPEPPPPTPGMRNHP